MSGLSSLAHGARGTAFLLEEGGEAGKRQAAFEAWKAEKRLALQERRRTGKEFEEDSDDDEEGEEEGSDEEEEEEGMDEAEPPTLHRKRPLPSGSLQSLVDGPKHWRRRL